MMKKITLTLLLVVHSLLSAEKHALLVGINNYQNDIGALKYCVSDVEAFRATLIQVVGYKPRNVHLMTDQMSGQDLPNFINILLRLENLANRIQIGDTFIFYFSGHGISTQDQSYLLALDSNTTTYRTLKRSAIPIEEVNDILSGVKAQQILTIIDACRNDPSAGRSNQDNLLSENFARGFQLEPRTDVLGQPAVSANLYACSIGERAYEWAEKKQGVFSYFMLKGLQGEAVNEDGEVTITELANYTQQKVGEWTLTYRGKKQTPWLVLKGKSNLVLAENLSRVRTKIIRASTTNVDAEAEMWEMAKHSTNISDIEDFLQAFPAGELSPVAQLKLKQLKRKMKIVEDMEIAKTKPNKTRVTFSNKDKAKMEWIPSGTYLMGAGKNEIDDSMRFAKPTHKVELNGFYMDAYEITVGQYKKFLAETGHRALPDWVSQISPTDGHPVVGVSWHDAVSYCQWVGKRLPTEAEWEYAARGGLSGKRYPWGDPAPNGSQCNYADKNANTVLTEINEEWTWSNMQVNDGYAKCAPVGRYEPNGYGLYDMGGNVSEWCADWYGKFYYKNTTSKNPLGPNSGTTRVLRGGSWPNSVKYIHVANRNDSNPDDRNSNCGFRCVLDLDID